MKTYRIELNGNKPTKQQVLDMFGVVSNGGLITVYESDSNGLVVDTYLHLYDIDSIIATNKKESDTVTFKEIDTLKEL